MQRRNVLVAGVLVVIAVAVFIGRTYFGERAPLHPLAGNYAVATSPLPELRVTLADPAWNGRVVPAGQQCRRFQGGGGTPALQVDDIPAGANALLIEFNDETYRPMDNGGHGIVGFRTGGPRVVAPSIPGETLDGLPAAAFIEVPHRAGDYGGPGYLPPCSGGQGNLYTITVKAVFKSETNPADNKLLAQTRVELGRY
jgi:hypothetical protein